MRRWTAFNGTLSSKNSRGGPRRGQGLYETSVKPKDAKDVVKFLDYFLVYAFDLPKEIGDYRKRREGKPQK